MYGQSTGTSGRNIGAGKREACRIEPGCAAIVLQNLALAQIGMTDLPDGAFEMDTLVRFAGYSFLTSMPVLSFMLLISSRFENMWVPLGIGVAGFLSGMALANSGLTLLLVHPFVIILKPAVAMSAQPDSTVALVALVEDLGGTLRHTIRTVLRSYDSRASGDLLCSHRQGAWQM